MGSWKLPVLMAFDTAVTSTLLLQLVAALEDLGYPVRAVVRDMGPQEHCPVEDPSGQTRWTHGHSKSPSNGPVRIYVCLFTCDIYN